MNLKKTWETWIRSTKCLFCGVKKKTKKFDFVLFLKIQVRGFFSKNSMQYNVNLTVWRHPVPIGLVKDLYFYSISVPNARIFPVDMLLFVFSLKLHWFICYQTTQFQGEQNVNAIVLSVGWQVSQMLTVFWIGVIWDDAVEQLQKSILIPLSNEQGKHLFGQLAARVGGQQ